MIDYVLIATESTIRSASYAGLASTLRFGFFQLNSVPQHMQPY